VGLNILDNLAVNTEDKKVGNIVLAGSWDNYILDTLIDNKPEKVIVLEPDPGLFQSMSESKAEQPLVKVKEIALSQSTGNANYFLFHPNRFSSLNKQKKLKKIYKNQKNSKTIEVATVDLRTLCEQEDIVQKGGNILLIGTNCSATKILNTEQSQALKLFDVVIISCAKLDLYDFENAHDVFGSFLADNNFTLSQEINRDALCIQYVYKRDYHSEKMKLLDNEIADVVATNAMLEAKIGELSAENEKQLTKSEAEVTNLEDQTGKLNIENTKLKTQIDKLINENGLSVEKIRVLESEIENLKGDAIKLRNQNSESKAQNETLISENLQHKERNDKLSKHNNSLIKQNETLNTENLQYKERNDKLSNHNTQLIGQNEILSTESKELKDRNEKLSNHNTQLIEQNKLHEAESNKQKERDVDRTQSASELKGQNDTLALKVKEQDSQISKLVSEKDFLSSKNDDLEHCIAELDNEMVKLEAQIELVNKVFIQV
jgi:FkbM family methyltransferase